MKLLRIMLIVLMLCSFSALSLSCAPGEESTVAETEVVTVQRGDLTIDITAVGNLALSHKENLAFEMSGTVEEVLVEEGDSVEEGQVLAKLDTSEWQDQITTLERQLEIKKLDLLQAEINLTNAEIALTNAEISLNETGSAEYQKSCTSKAELDVANAKVALHNAQTKYDEAKETYESNWTVPEWIVDYELKSVQLAIAELNLIEAEEALSNVPTDIEKMLADIELEIEKKQKDLAIAQSRLVDAQKAVEEAQAELDEAQGISPVITAPFAGFITRVNIDGGDEVKKGTVAVELADPTKFEADILVSEMDIFQVKVGGNATVQVDALQTIVLPAEVTHIAPTATIQAGVVNYEVKVELQSLEAIIQERQEAGQEAMQERQQAMQEAMEKMQQGELPEVLKRAVEAGRITQEEAEEMMERMQSGEMSFQPPEGEMPFQPPEGGMPFMPEGSEGQMPFTLERGLTQTILPEDFQLREGLTVTVSIIVDERQDVLLVPNTAITSQRGQTYVQVLSPDGTIEERAITTGISDYQYTEVIEGLSEGEKVVIPTTTTTTPERGGPGFFFGP